MKISVIHILPNNEKDLHTEFSNCICEPSVMIEDEIIIVHNRINTYKSSEGTIDEPGKLAEK